MILSMTGFAAAICDIPGGQLTLELRAVNHRFLDLQLRLPEELRILDPQLREQIAARIGRGKVECRLNLQAGHGGARSLALNTALLDQLADAQAGLRARFADAAPLSVNELLRWPGMLADDGLGFDEMLPAIVELTNAALDELVATRRREGDKLADMIRERVVRMRELVTIATPRMPAVVAEYQERLTAKLRDAVASLDEDRIRQEVALYAQRIDVDEELTRLNTHLDEVERILKAGGAAGKRLDFLMQELNREANTLGSKAFDPRSTQAAVNLKVLIEQMREQVQNIE